VRDPTPEWPFGGTSTIRRLIPTRSGSKGLLTCFRDNGAGRGAGRHTDLQAPALMHATLARVCERGTRHSQLLMPHWRPQYGMCVRGVACKLVQSGTKRSVSLLKQGLRPARVPEPLSNQGPCASVRTRVDIEAAIAVESRSSRSGKAEDCSSEYCGSMNGPLSEASLKERAISTALARFTCHNRDADGRSGY
jgi:hypothetical protein